MLHVGRVSDCPELCLGSCSEVASPGEACEEVVMVLGVTESHPL